MDDKVKVLYDNWMYIKTNIPYRDVNVQTAMGLIGDMLMAIVSLDERLREQLTVGDLEKYIGYTKEGYVPERDTITIREFNKKVEEIKMLEQP